MAERAGAPDPRRGTLFRASAAVYRYLVAELAFITAALPGFVGILLLDRVPSNIPLYALCLVPVAPAFSALLAVRGGDGDADVWPEFWRAWARNVLDVLWVWVPALVVACVLGITLAFGGVVGVDGFFLGTAIVLLVLLAVVTVNALVIASTFSFRARDTARLALYYLAARPLVSLGTLSLLILATAVIAFTSDWVLVLAAAAFASMLGINDRPLVADVTVRFTAPDDAAPELGGPTPRQ